MGLVIANAKGYWGDNRHGLEQVINGGHVDVVVADYLAEITMGICTKLQQRGKPGYISEFLEEFKPVYGKVKANGTKIIVNAGALDPLGLAVEFNNLFPGMEVAAITGDDIIDDLDRLIESGNSFSNMDSGENFSSIKGNVISANVYIGAEPIALALAKGAQVVITGRATDTALTLAPIIHKYGWKLDDWDRLASGIVAGHLIECGTQVTGGNHSRPADILSYKNIGFPLVDVEEDGSFVLSKHKGTGGLVSLNTVTQQMLYEMGKPGEYISPDLIASFLTVKLEDAGENRVRVTGVKGAPYTDTYKASISYDAGYKSEGAYLISTRNISEQIEAVKESLTGLTGIDFVGKSGDERILMEFNGVNVNTPEKFSLPPSGNGRLRIALHSYNEEKISNFAKHFNSTILSTVGGITYEGGNPRKSGAMEYWPALINKSDIDTKITLINDKSNPIVIPGSDFNHFDKLEIPVPEYEFPTVKLTGKTESITLGDYAWAISGDKGDSANIGLWTDNPGIYAWINDCLTISKVKEIFSDHCEGEVKRFSIPNVNGFNYLVGSSLGGKNGPSLRIDKQGKLFASRLLDQRFMIDTGYLQFKA